MATKAGTEGSRVTKAELAYYRAAEAAGTPLEFTDELPSVLQFYSVYIIPVRPFTNPCPCVALMFCSRCREGVRSEGVDLVGEQLWGCFRGSTR